MQKLSEKYRPARLNDVAGQPVAVAVLRAWSHSPYPTCWLLSGAPGVGKTSSALALARDLQSEESTTVVCCSELGVENARELMRRLALRPMFGAGKWQVLILEELERLSPQCQVFLKVALENLPARSVVIATSNGTGALDPAVVQRFTELPFAADDSFRSAAADKIAAAWATETDGSALPRTARDWGVTAGGFSLRVAYDQMQTALLLRSAGVNAESDSHSSSVEFDCDDSCESENYRDDPVAMIKAWRQEGFKSVRIENGKTVLLRELIETRDTFALNSPDALEAVEDAIAAGAI